MNESNKKRGRDTDSSNSHIYKILSPLMKHLKEYHNLTKEDLISIMQNSGLIK